MSPFPKAGLLEVNIMYGLPEEFDPSFFYEKEVESICFYKYQCNIYFEGGVWIQIEGRYKLIEDGELAEDLSEFPISQSMLLRLIGQKVGEVEFISSSGDLNIIFEGGLIELLIQGDIGNYESYRFYDGEKEIVV